MIITTANLYLSLFPEPPTLQPESVGQMEERILGFVSREKKKFARL